MTGKEQKLRDCMFLLKLSYEIYKDYENDEDVQMQIMKIYNNFHKKLKRNTYKAPDVAMLYSYLEAINTYERKTIIALGKKVAKLK